MFELYLSDRDGNFIASDPIGVFKSHFATFVNGKIPEGILSGFYRLKIEVKNSGDIPHKVLNTPIKIVGGVAPVIHVAPSDNSRVLVVDQIWGFCSNIKDKGKDYQELVVRNSTAPNASLSGVLKDDYNTGTPNLQFDFEESNLQTLKLKDSYYTATFRSEREGVVSTKSYVILSSTNNNSLQSEGAQTACISNADAEDTGSVKFSMNIGIPSSSNKGSILTNYPGLAYQFDWGDGNIDLISQSELIALNGIASHKYSKPSCNQPVANPNQPVYNAYQVSISVNAPFCTGASFPIQTYSKVFSAPVASFDISGGRGCLNEPVTIINETIPGMSENSEGTACTDYTSYLWYVKKKSEPESSWKLISDETNLSYRFKEVGVYSVKLVASNNSCPPSEKISDICIEADPELDFSFTQSADCYLSGSSPVRMSLENKTKVKGSCGIAWLWKIMDAATGTEVLDGVKFLGSREDLHPGIEISVPGDYLLRLESTNSCKTLILEKPFTVAGPLTVALPDINPKYCRDYPVIVNFAEDKNLKPTYTGFAKNKIYKWEVSGGDYHFEEHGASDPFPIISFNASGVYRVSVTYNSECDHPVTETRMVTLYGPIIKDAGADAFVCDNIPGEHQTTFQLKGNTPQPQESGRWSVVDGPPNAFISGEASPNAIISGLIPGTYHLRWTISNDAGCDEFDDMTLEVYAKPVGGQLSGSQSVCVGNGGTLKLTDYSGKILSWESSTDQITWTGISHTLEEYAFLPISKKTFFRVNVASLGQAAGCSSVVKSEIFVVDVDPETKGGTTSGAATYCVTSESGKIDLTGHTGNVVRWESSTDDGHTWNLIQSTATSYSYSKLKFTTQFRAIVKSGSCSEASSSVTSVQILPLPTEPYAGENEILCEGTTTFTLKGNRPEVGSGLWKQTAGPTVSFDDANRHDATIAGLQTGAHYEFTWEISNGICRSEPDKISIEVISAIQNTIKADRLISCKNEAVKLTTALLTGGASSVHSAKYTFRWEQLVGTMGVWTPVVNGTKENIEVFPIATTKYRRIAKSHGKCEVVSPEIEIVVNDPTPESKAGESQILCNETSYKLNANDAGHFTGTWRDSDPLSKLSFSPDNHAHNATVSNLVAGKTYVLEWVISGVSPCPDERSAVTLTVRKPVTQATVGEKQEICILKDNSNNHTVLTGNLPDISNGEKGFWKLLSGPEGLIFEDANQAKTKVSNLKGGVYKLEWNISSDASSADASCKTSSAQLIISVVDYPTLGTIHPVALSICKGSSPGLLKLSGYSPADILQWQISTDGKSYDDLPGVTLSDYSAPALASTTWYRVKITQGGGCQTFVFTEGVKITVDEPSIGGEITSAKSRVCIGDAVRLKVSGHRGSIVRWEVSTDGGDWTPLNVSSEELTNHIPQQTSRFRAVVRNGTCDEVRSSEFLIEVLPNVTIAKVGADQYLCNETEFSLTANQAEKGLGSWTQVSGPVCRLDDPSGYRTTVSGASPGEYVFRWSISNGICDPSIAEVRIFNYPAIVNAITGTTTVCSGQHVQLFNDQLSGGNGTYQYSWEVSTDEINWTLLTAAVLKDYTNVFTATSYLRRKITSGPCSSVSNSVKITVQPAVANNSISQDQVLCLGEASAVIAGTIPTGGDGNFFFQWQISENGSDWTDLPDEIKKDYAPPVLTHTSWYRRIVTTALCKGAQKNVSEPVRILINPLAKAEFSSTTYISCTPFDLKKAIMLEPYEDRNGDFEWYADDVLIGRGREFPGYTIVRDGEKVIIKLIAKSKFGCGQDILEKEFYTVKNVVASFTKDKVQDCGPLSVSFTNTSTPIAGGNYIWDFGNGQTSTEAQPGAIVFQPHPAHRDTTYIITLRANSGCETTEYRDSVLVRPQPKAVFSPDVVVGCSPLTVNFSNQSAGGPNKYTFDFGDGDKVVTTDNTSLTHTFYVTKTDTIVVTLLAENECGTDTTSHNIVVYPNTVTPELVVDGNRKFGCAPFTVRFNNNSLGANRFHWDFKDGSQTTTTTSPAFLDHTFLEPGVYEVSLLATNGCSSGVTTETITVYPVPDARFTFDSQQYCKNDPVTFQSQPTPSSTYAWDFGDGTKSNEANPKHTFLNEGVYNVKLTVLQSHPDGSVCSNVSSQQVKILALPVALFTSNSANLNCVPFKLQVTTTPSNAATVRWNFGDIQSPYNNASGYNAEHIYTKPGIYKVTEFAYNESGCIDSMVRTIKVVGKPTAAFSASDTLICGTSGTILFTNKSTGDGAEALTYKWIVNDKPISTQENLSHRFVVPAGSSMPYVSKVKLVAVNILGCSDTTEVVIRHNPLPVARFELKSNPGCAPLTLDIKNTSEHADSFLWYLNGKLVSNEKEPSTIVASLQDTTYSVRLIVSNTYGCKVDTTDKILRTHPKPEAYFTITDSLSCNGKLEVKPKNLSERAIRYQWDFGDGSPLSTDPSPAHIYGKPGTYYLRLTAFDGQCSDVFKRTIRISALPQAAFTSDVQKGCSLTGVTFENLSINASCYLWDFGDGTFSTEKNPTHRYTSEKSPYNVKLTAYGEFGCYDVTVQTQYITVSQPPVANFEILPNDVIKVPDFTFSFKNTSEGKPKRYEWDLGDGSISSEESPSHTYREPGEYTVSLIVTTEAGCADTLRKVARIEGVPGYLYVPSGFEPANMKQDLKTFLPKGSGIATYSLKVFNKWGQLIWQTDKLDDQGTPTEGWDGNIGGSPAPQGVYVWRIEARFIEGSEWKGMKYKTGPRRTVGSINLIR
ncbi:PKD domain-containing protein [Arcticibacter pallidicorallinus]|uniref:PKD domain-containing protein n=1 Tax=Arcticibacter pallidicorallinus TaxID=1259464 RepID=UPI0015E7D368|nr:PKD domain-containing protein [Arcticibacter pallidicorallinus]